MIRKFVLMTLMMASAAGVRAQTACPALQAPVPDPAKLLFTPQQEQQLGEIIRQQLESDFLVIEDPAVTDYLRRVGEQVAKQLPTTGLRYEFLLYDQPEIQAFAMPGGRVYVSRKMVAFLRSEDELAGLLGHELGHVAARQQALELSQKFRDILGVKSIAGNEDLFEKYNQLVENARLKKGRGGARENEERGQVVADQLGVEAVARAGYAAQAFPDFLDRLMETKGKTGNWLSDLFGATRPDSKRLREALKTVGALPTGCVETRTASRSEDFRKWQNAVLRYSGIGHEERLSGVLRREKLKDPLRGDIEHFRFSPDGKYLLAQDDSGIYVLTREPLQFVFRIDAPQAAFAQFSPDSRQAVFYTPSLRVETWDIERRERTGIADVAAVRGCHQTALSPDARYLVCFGTQFDLTLYDVNGGETLYHKDKFYEPEYALNPYAAILRFLMLILRKELVVLRFSPDGHYFAASSPSGQDVVFDLLERKKMNVPGTIHDLMKHTFTFTGPGQIVGVDTFRPGKSPVAEFPSGKVIDRFPLGEGALTAATNPRYLLIRPIQGKPVGAFDLQQKKFVFANRMAATDVWGETSVSERLNGEVGLYQVTESKPQTTLQLPLGNLGALQAASATPDLKWLAISSRTRGGIWNLETQERAYYARGFATATGQPNQIFYLDFPEFEKAERTMQALNPATQQFANRIIDKDDDVMLFGGVVLRTKHMGKNQEHKNIEVDAVETAKGKPLWSKTFPKQGPRISGSPASGKLVFWWSGKTDGAKEEMARNPRLQQNLAKQPLGDTDYFLEVVSAESGEVLGGSAVRTGKQSFALEHLEAAGDWVVGTDNMNRILLFSTATGEEKARWFGYRPRISPNGERLCVMNGRGHLVIYDLRTLKQNGELWFTNPVSTMFFSGDGSRLAVLTNDQQAFLFDVAKVGPAVSGVRATAN